MLNTLWIAYGRGWFFVRAPCAHPSHDFLMGGVHAGFVEVLERTVTALVPRVFARGNGLKPLPRIHSMDHEV